MLIFTTEPHAFKRASQAVSKLESADTLSACQTAIARATGHRDVHHMQALQAKSHLAASVPTDAQASIVSNLQKSTGLRAGDLLDALIRARFFDENPDPAIALAVREAMFDADFADRGRHAVGSPCRMKASGYNNQRALVVERGEGPSSLSTAMLDHGIMTCVSREMPAYRGGSVFIPLRFWMPYGFWVEEDGSKVIFSRDYCPLWKIQEGKSPLRDDPDRDVRFIDQQWFFDEGSFRGPIDDVSKQGMDILREHRVVSLPRLVEWFPECLTTGRWISALKRWPGGPQVVRAG